MCSQCCPCHGHAVVRGPAVSTPATPHAGARSRGSAAPGAPASCRLPSCAPLSGWAFVRGARATDEPTLSLEAFRRLTPACFVAAPAPVPIVASSARVFRFVGRDFLADTHCRLRRWLLAHLPASLRCLELDFGLDARLLRQLSRFTRLQELAISGSGRAFANSDPDISSLLNVLEGPLPALPIPHTLIACVPTGVRTLTRVLHRH